MSVRDYPVGPRIYIDMDGVVADFEKQCAKVGLEPKIAKLLNDTYLNLEPMPKSDTIVETLRVPIEVIEGLKQHGLDVEEELANILKAFVDEEIKKLDKAAALKELSADRVVYDHKTAEYVAVAPIKLPIIRKLLPEILAEELVSVQPMTDMQAEIFKTNLCPEVVTEEPVHKPLPKVSIEGLQGFDSGVQSYCPILQGDLNDPSNLPGRRRSS